MDSLQFFVFMVAIGAVTMFLIEKLVIKSYVKSSPGLLLNIPSTSQAPQNNPVAGQTTENTLQ